MRQSPTNANVGLFGWTRTDARGERKKHHGLDLLAPVGFPVFAAHVGVVTSARVSGAAGLRIKLVSDFDGDNVENGSVGTRYAHLMSSYVDVHERVVAGQIVGRVGTSGNADGIEAGEIHLHFETRLWMDGSWWLVDPRGWLRGETETTLVKEGRELG